MPQFAAATASISSIATLPRRGPRRERRWSHRAPCTLRILAPDLSGGGFVPFTGEAGPGRAGAHRTDALRPDCDADTPAGAPPAATAAAVDELRGETVNMSPNGLAIQVGKSIPAGAVVEAIIARWSGREELRLHGRVVHARRMLAGLFEIGVRLMPDPA